RSASAGEQESVGWCAFGTEIGVGVVLRRRRAESPTGPTGAVSIHRSGFPSAMGQSESKKTTTPGECAKPPKPQNLPMLVNPHGLDVCRPKVCCPSCGTVMPLCAKPRPVATCPRCRVTLMVEQRADGK